ncbi:MAG: hypothetical protein IPP51_12035 [Bacteroidetes bacterium]|nr:hypothetical protein [Bacteroidota bacterium]
MYSLNTSFPRISTNQLKGLKMLVFSAVFVFGGIAFSHAQVTPSWKQNFKNSLNTINKAVSLQIDRSGNCFVLGTSWMPDSAKDIVLVKYSPEGNEVWRRVYDNPSHGDDIATAMTIDSKENIWVCGIAKSPTTNGDFVVARFTQQGINDVGYIYDGTDHLFDAASTIVSGKNGNIYCAGYTTSADSGLDFLMVCLDQDGSPMWKDIYKSISLDMAADMCVDDSSNVYVCGTTNAEQRQSDMLIRKYNPQGVLKWNRIYDGVFGERDAGLLITSDDSTNIYISGITNHTSDRSDIPVLKYNRNGILQKEILYNGRIADCYPNFVSAGKNDIFVVATSIDYTTQVNSTMLMKFNKGGKEKFVVKAEEDIRFGWLRDLGKQHVVLGSMLTHPESTLIPFMAGIDSAGKFTWSFRDSLVYGIAHIIDAKVAGNSVYFLADDAGDATGTITLLKYNIADEGDKKKNTHGKNIQSGVHKN